MKVEEINEIKVNNIPAYPLEVNNNPLEDETKAPEIYDEDKRTLHSRVRKVDSAILITFTLITVSTVGIVSSNAFMVFQAPYTVNVYDISYESTSTSISYKVTVNNTGTYEVLLELYRDDTMVTYEVITDSKTYEGEFTGLYDGLYKMDFVATSGDYRKVLASKEVEVK